MTLTRGGVGTSVCAEAAGDIAGPLKREWCAAPFHRRVVPAQMPGHGRSERRVANVKSTLAALCDHRVEARSSPCHPHYSSGFYGTTWGGDGLMRWSELVKPGSSERGTLKPETLRMMRKARAAEAEVALGDDLRRVSRMQTTFYDRSVIPGVGALSYAPFR